MKTEDIIGMTVTNIYSFVKTEVGGLDTGECFIELDHKTIIDIPFGIGDNIRKKALNKDAVNLFADFYDYPIYHVNEDNKTSSEIVNSEHRKRTTITNRLRKIFLGRGIKNKDYQPFKVESRENKLKHIKDRKIIDFLWSDNQAEKGFFLLDNGYLITEITIAPHGTGLAGLNYYESIEFLKQEKATAYYSLVEKKGNR